MSRKSEIILDNLHKIKYVDEWQKAMRIINEERASEVSEPRACHEAVGDVRRAEAKAGAYGKEVSHVQ